MSDRKNTIFKKVIQRRMLEEMVCFQYTNDISRMFKNSDHKQLQKTKNICL